MRVNGVRSFANKEMVYSVICEALPITNRDELCIERSLFSLFAHKSCFPESQKSEISNIHISDLLFLVS